MSLHALVSVNPIGSGRVFYGNNIPTAPDGNTYVPGDFIQFVPYPAGAPGPTVNPPYGWWCKFGGAGGIAIWDTAGFSNPALGESGANNAIVVPGSANATAPLMLGLMVTVQLNHSLQAGANTCAYNGNAPIPIKSSLNPANDIAAPYAASGVIGLYYNGSVWLDLKQ